MLLVVKQRQHGGPVALQSGRKGGNNFRIPLTLLSLIFQGGFGVGRVHGLTVRTVAREGIKYIGYLENPRHYRDVVAGQTVGITAAVPVLMVVPDDGQHIPEASQRVDYGLPNYRMGAHNLPFPIVEGAGLQEDGVRDADLAHVMQITGTFESAQRVLRQPDPFAERDCKVADSLAVIAGFKITGFDATCQGLQNLLSVLKISIGPMRAGQHARPGRHLESVEGL